MTRSAASRTRDGETQEPPQDRLIEKWGTARQERLWKAYRALPLRALRCVRMSARHEEDGYEAAALPHCPQCATVLRPVVHAYWCATCQVVSIGV